MFYYYICLQHPLGKPSMMHSQPMVTQSNIPQVSPGQPGMLPVAGVTEEGGKKKKGQSRKRPSSEVPDPSTPPPPQFLSPQQMQMLQQLQQNQVSSIN